jgi:hypothetical protein
MGLESGTAWDGDACWGELEAGLSVCDLHDVHAFLRSRQSGRSEVAEVCGGFTARIE